ncbi:glycosyltransferase family 2 protein [Flavobacterium sp.]|uniref:glycosyltransferase family 2 protein n=1 Tax=Flavobacterium sp. TaxID=239 RepID=UPI004048596C
MLSILITIYNYNLFPLVQELHKQCIECNIDFEILTQDDASNSVYNIENLKIDSLSNCRFFILDKNVGYRENKNILVQKSKYNYLLILDGDCKITNPKFIKNYLDYCNEYDAIYGGRIHPEKSPSKQQLLRWKYGKFMEDQDYKKRLNTPYRSFLFNNTFIKKEIFNTIKFDNSFKKYGHDDTLFSFELKKNFAKIHHIQNPVIHDDIDTNVVFYNKMKGSLENLHYLYINKMITMDHSKMITLIEKLRKNQLTKPIAMIYSIFNSLIERNLTSSNPKLFVFNIFRLGYFCTLKIKYNESSNNK